jgi:hypothetical protein
METTRVFDLVKRRKSVHAVFEPLELDDRHFGAAFEEFRAKMLMGGNYRMNCTFAKTLFVLKSEQN